MTVRNSQTKKNAKLMAMRFRKMGFRSTVFKKDKGYGISVTRKKK